MIPKTIRATSSLGRPCFEFTGLVLSGLPFHRAIPLVFFLELDSNRRPHILLNIPALLDKLVKLHGFVTSYLPVGGCLLTTD